MKKGINFLALILVLVLIISASAVFGGCKTTEEAAEETTEEVAESAETTEEVVESAETTETVAESTETKPGEGMYFVIVTSGSDDSFWTVWRQGVNDASDQLGCDVTFSASVGDMAKQQQAFNEAVASKPDGIALVINDATAWDQPVADAIDAGIPVIGTNQDDPEGAIGNRRLCYIGESDYDFGYTEALQLFKAAEDKGIDITTAKIVQAAELPGLGYATLSAQGFQQAMKDYGVTSEMEILDTSTELTVIEERETAYLIAHPDTTIIWGAGGGSTEMLGASIKAANLEGKIIAGGRNLAAATLEAIKEGTLVCTLDQQPYLQGYFSVYVLYLYNKYRFTPEINTGGAVIDKNSDIDLILELAGKYR